MARKRGGGRRTNFQNYMKGAINVDVVPGALVTLAAISGITPAIVDTTRVSSIRTTITLSSFTPAINEGPLLAYVAHSDYTDAEIAGYIVAAGSWDRGDMIAREVRSRRIRILGVLESPANSTQAVAMNDGRSMHAKLNWLLTEGQRLKLGVFNTGSLVLNTTTASNINFYGHANLWQT